MDLQNATNRIAAQGELVEKIKNEVGKVIVGQERLIDRLVLALVSDGHILLEGVPGLAKTLSVNTLAKVLGLDFKRISFTPDLLPADVVGTLIYSPKTGGIYITAPDKVNPAKDFPGGLLKPEFGYGTGLEDCAINGGVALSGLVDKWLVMRDAATAADAAKIARGLQDVVTDALARGDNVIFYPSGHIWTEPREEIGTRQLAYNVCRLCIVLLILLDRKTVLDAEAGGGQREYASDNKQDADGGGKS